MAPIRTLKLGEREQDDRARRGLEERLDAVLELPQATYMLLLPVVAKGLIWSFVSFSIAYPQWARRRVKAATTET